MADGRQIIPSTPRTLRAFSLVELLIVMAIMAILAGIAVPRYGMAASRQQADAAARRIAADLDEARQAARSSSASVRVVFTISTGAYDVIYPATGSVAALTRTVRLNRPPLSAKLVSAAFGSPATTTITFNGYGVAAAGGTVKVSAGSTTKTITVFTDLASSTVQ